MNMRLLEELARQIPVVRSVGRVRLEYRSGRRRVVRSRYWGEESDAALRRRITAQMTKGPDAG